uniref:Opioid growth factor receptor n=1 Tax=Sphenodon punctatus TaxID=8508 RepID=A0A8D0HBE2_SPHPU
MQRYRHRYPGLEETENDDGEEEMWNLSFYRNEICFKPRGMHIEELLENWQDDYMTLEENHSYIQWLFPLRERGMNWHARSLTYKEIQVFCKSKDVMQRFVRAYELMLGFYGIRLVNLETGEVARAENWFRRFQNLDRYSHNNLRITRILKCLGEMGYEHYQVQLVKFFLMETLVHKMLPSVRRSALDYFMFTVRTRQKRRELVHYAWQHFVPQHKFAWGPRKKLLKFKPQSPEFRSFQRLDKEQGPVGGGEVAGNIENQPPNERQVIGDAAGIQTKQPIGERSSGKLGDAEEAQIRKLSSEESREPDPEVTVRAGAERGDGAEEKPISLLQPEGKELVGEFAIDQEISKSLPAVDEMVEQPALEGSDAGNEGLKESESVDAVAKRRKVDELVPENDTLEMAPSLNAEITSSDAQIINPELKEDECKEMKVIEKNSGEFLNVAETPVNSGTTEHGLLPPAEDERPPDKANAVETNMVVAEGEPQDCETLPAREREARGNTQVKEGANLNEDKPLDQGSSQQSIEASCDGSADAGNVVEEMGDVESAAELTLNPSGTESQNHLAVSAGTLEEDALS